MISGSECKTSVIINIGIVGTTTRAGEEPVLSGKDAAAPYLMDTKTYL